jgi:hypothetical protein
VFLTSYTFWWKLDELAEGFFLAWAWLGEREGRGPMIPSPLTFSRRIEAAVGSAK